MLLRLELHTHFMIWAKSNTSTLLFGQPLWPLCGLYVLRITSIFWHVSHCSVVSVSRPQTPPSGCSRNSRCADDCCSTCCCCCFRPGVLVVMVISTSNLGRWWPTNLGAEAVFEPEAGVDLTKRRSPWMRMTLSATVRCQWPHFSPVMRGRGQIHPCSILALTMMAMVWFWGCFEDVFRLGIVCIIATARVSQKNSSNLSLRTYKSHREREEWITKQ